MAIAGLAFRPRFGNSVPKDELHGIVLRGEVEWIVEGGEAEVAALITAVAGLGDRVTTQSAILKFGNVVGTFDLGSLGVVRVECGKWGEEEFDALLDDLTNQALALPFSATQAAGLPHDRSIADRDDVLLHAFIYARQILLGTGRSLSRALELVVRDPHRRFNAERTRVDLIAASRVDARTVTRVAMGADGAIRAIGRAAHTGLAHALRGHLPAAVDVPRVENTFDTAENRFVLEFLKQLRAIVDRVERIARSKAKPSFWTRAAVDCETMRRVLGPFERHDMWNDVGRMGHVPIGSSVLQRRRGYKDILRHHLALRAAAKIPFDRTTAERLLGLKDIAKLYELWCYFAVVGVVAEVVGRSPDKTSAMKLENEVALGNGFRVAWTDGPTVYYNLSFTPVKKEPQHRSASLRLRPDVVIEIKRNGHHELHVLDAKLRIDGEFLAAEPEEDDETTELNPLSFQNDDIAKMHAYRDALPHVRSARVLYPGNESAEFPALEPHARDTDGVGAIPLVPGTPPVELRRVLTRILGKETSSMTHDRENVPDEPTVADLAAVAAMFADIEQIKAKPAEWRGGKKQADASIEMPYAVNEPAVDRLIRAVYDHRIVILAFDWASWQEDARRFLDPAVMRTASLVEVRQLLTLHVRGEHFSEGHFAEMISNGHVSALLYRLAELAREMSTGV